MLINPGKSANATVTGKTRNTTGTASVQGVRSWT